MSIADANNLTEELLRPDRTWQETRWGRIDQGRRELAAILGKDLTMEMLARAIGLTQPSLSGWKSGGRPKPESLEALAKVFLAAGLQRFTASFLDWGDQPAALVAERPPTTPYQRAETREEEAAREQRAAKKTGSKRRTRGAG